MRRLAALVLTALAAGCVDPGAAPLPDDAFWMVWVHGEEPHPCPGRACGVPECDLRFDHGVDRERRAFHHLNASPPADPWLVLAYDVMTVGGCPVAYRHAFDVERDVQRLGETTLVLEATRDGTVRVDGVALRPGESRRVAWTAPGGPAEALVEHLGAWKEADVRTSWP
ncbi:MAG TPA: hypothetical protein VNX21_06025 [Candidatus Thermoplasmatota archaeon]|nr:hypothetical protein [Candidatus Thermoplasmatota archaeon]